MLDDKELVKRVDAWFGDEYARIMRFKRLYELSERDEKIPGTPYKPTEWTKAVDDTLQVIDANSRPLTADVVRLLLLERKTAVAVKIELGLGGTAMTTIKRKGIVMFAELFPLVDFETGEIIVR